MESLKHELSDVAPEVTLNQRLRDKGFRSPRGYQRAASRAMYGCSAFEQQIRDLSRKHAATS